MGSIRISAKIITRKSRLYIHEISGWPVYTCTYDFEAKNTFKKVKIFLARI